MLHRVRQLLKLCSLGSLEKRAEIHFKDGKTKNVLVEELTDYITKITDESAETAASKRCSRLLSLKPLVKTVYR